MSKKVRREQKGKSPKPQQKGVIPKKSLLRTAFAKAGGTFLVCLSMLALLSVLPRISVTPGDPPDTNNSMSASFLITNTGFVPLRHVTVALGLGEVTHFVSGPLADQPVPTEPPSTKRGFVYTDWVNHNLDMDESFTVSPGQVFSGTGYGEANIALLISYRLWFLPWTRQKYVHLHTKRTTNGNLTWYILPNDQMPVD